MILTLAAGAALLLAVVNALFWPRVGRAQATSARVSVLIPARNEETNIEACIAAVKGQLCVLEILVYDDHSTDKTRVLALAAATVLDSVPLPEGWCGKNFACAQLALHASGDWLLFLDADARVSGDAIPRIVNEAASRGLTFLSCWPGLELMHASESVLMPLLNFVVFTLFPAPLSLFRSDPSLGLAHGSCMLFDRVTYERLGGHGLVAGQIFEDTRLAQAWRQLGERGLCLDGQDVVRVRMYASFGEIWRGFQKNFYPAFQNPFMFWLFLLLHFTVFLLPFLIADWSAAGLVVAARVVLAARFRQPWWSALLHPFGEAVLLAVGFSSWLRCQSGRGVEWKGRMYRTRGA